jgi:hypothetical protein
MLPRPGHGEWATWGERLAGGPDGDDVCDVPARGGTIRLFVWEG